MANITGDTVENEFEGVDLTNPRYKEIAEANAEKPEVEVEPKVEGESESNLEAEENPTDDTKPESTETDGETPVKEKSTKSISNREAKRLAYHNKQLQQRLDDLESMIRGSQAKKVESKPTRGQFSNDEDYLESMVLHKHQEIELARQKEDQAYLKQQQEYETQAEGWNQKIASNFKTEQEQQEYAEALETLGHPGEVLDDRINNYIFRSPVGPKIIKYLSDRPSVIPALLNMHDWDLSTSLQQIAAFVNKKPIDNKSSKSQPSNATPIGKLGAGKAGVSKSVDDMSDAELMSAYREGKLKL